jgi:hypothetical protein
MSVRDTNYILKEELCKSPHPSTKGCVVKILEKEQNRGVET